MKTMHWSSLRSAVTLLALSSLFAASCGGGSGGGRHTPGKGVAKLIIDWPASSLPVNERANSITAYVLIDRVRVATAVLVRPASGSGETTAKLENLPSKNAQLVAIASNSYEGSGVQVAGATVPYDLRSGNSVTTTFAIDTPVESVEVVSDRSSVSVGTLAHLTATAYSHDHAVLLTAGPHWEWAAIPATGGDIKADGANVTFTGRGAGTVEVQATETESGQKGAFSMTVSGNTGLANSAWPKFQGNAMNTGRGSGSPATGQISWTYKASNSIASSPAIGPDGSIYFTTYDSTVVAVDSHGTEKWVYPLDTWYVRGSSPVLSKDGTLYVTTGTDQSLLALDSATGIKKWSATASTNGGAAESIPALTEDGTVYFGGGDGSFYALDAVTGTQKWKINHGLGLSACPAIGSDGTVYIPGASLFALDPANGNVKWSYTGKRAIRSSPAIGADGTVYFGSEDGNFYAVDGQSGALKWKAFTNGFMHTCPAIGPDGTVYAAEYLPWLPNAPVGALYAFNGQTGEIRWQLEIGKLVNSSPVIGADGTVYVGTDQGKFLGVDGQTGAIKWSVDISPVSSGSPAIGSDGTIYVGTKSGTLYAIH